MRDTRVVFKKPNSTERQPTMEKTCRKTVPARCTAKNNIFVRLHLDSRRESEMAFDDLEGKFFRLRPFMMEYL